jgi:hypothetical protein
MFPTTDLGWWAVGLAVAFFPLVFGAALLPRSAALAFVSGLGGGLLALVAIVRGRERAVSVFVALVPLAIVAAFLVTELFSSGP